ncbi:MAG TPA: hypothetical protein VJJ23_03100 [Candidatus Nanoarchaeia archaeon]|nr:hypothetical protein [Candidatus Nanoarchaeia archaeon]
MNKIQKIETLCALVASLNGCGIKQPEQKVNWSNFMAEIASNQPVRVYAQRDGSRQYVTEIPEIDGTLVVIDRDNDGNPEMEYCTKRDGTGWISHYSPQKSKNDHPKRVSTKFYNNNK